MKPDDIRMELEPWAQKVDHQQRNDVVIWHTHPRNNIGPSKLDLQNRVEGAAYLVVAIDVDTKKGVPTWF